MRCQVDINTEHNMKSIGRAAVAQWTKRLTRNGQTQVRIREAHIFDTVRVCVIREAHKSGSRVGTNIQTTRIGLLNIQQIFE